MTNNRWAKKGMLVLLILCGILFMVFGAVAVEYGELFKGIVFFLVGLAFASAGKAVWELIGDEEKGRWPGRF